MISVQENDFDVGAELAALRASRAGIGALAIFLGVVRDEDSGRPITALTLEHYPGMTERKLAGIEAEACRRWPLEASRVVHRYGRLRPGDQIVLVACAAAHRGDAFAACQFLVDWLKTRAPFWKQESTPAGERWVAARDEDELFAARWDRAEPEAAG